MDQYRDAKDRYVQAPTVDDMATQVNLNALFDMIEALADRVAQLEQHRKRIDHNLTEALRLQKNLTDQVVIIANEIRGGGA